MSDTTIQATPALLEGCDKNAIDCWERGVDDRPDRRAIVFAQEGGRFRYYCPSLKREYAVKPDALLFALDTTDRMSVASRENAELRAEVERLSGLVREYAAVQREHDRQLRESADGIESERHAQMYQDALKQLATARRDALLEAAALCGECPDAHWGPWMRDRLRAIAGDAP